MFLTINLLQLNIVFLKYFYSYEISWEVIHTTRRMLWLLGDLVILPFSINSNSLRISSIILKDLYKEVVGMGLYTRLIK